MLSIRHASRWLALAVVLVTVVRLFVNMTDCRTYLSVSEFESYSKVAAVANFDSGDIPWPENEVTVSPFVKGQPKLVLLLTYPNAGSMLLGQLFNTNKKAFYAIQPLDSLYTAMYGTVPGWNFPSDIFTTNNGTSRKISAKELQAVSKFLGFFITCDLSKWPTETLLHPFWMQFEHRILEPYSSCMKTKNFTQLNCHRFTAPYCGSRIGDQTAERLDDCNRLLWSEQYLAEHPSREVRKNFTFYRECQIDLRKRINDACAFKMAGLCRGRDFRVANVIRASMDAVEPLLNTFPNLRIIHVVRDPRAVAASRLEESGGTPSYRERSRFAAKIADRTQSLVAEATVYCRAVAHDLLKVHQLASTYQGRIYRLPFERFVREPVRYARNVYQFLDETIDGSTADWAANLRVFDSPTWHDRLTVGQSRRVMNACADLLSLIKSQNDELQRPFIVADAATLPSKS